MNQNRRKFLKIVFIGSGALLVEKILGPLFSKFLDKPPPSNNLVNRTAFGDFRVVENKKILSVHDSSGEEIFQIDKGA